MPRSTNRLTAIAIQKINAKADTLTAVAYISVLSGPDQSLGLSVHSGWCRHRTGLGPYPLVSLADARRCS